ncbi:hypothetical protein R3P38DRAFT_2514278 [Favolaschia claudopus]|uniref:Uncharacterized protein n=1 Tax=Favolaschia claudopus TaxID=2862362 RepID=A0AAW0CMV8_9AGAR
MHNEELMKYWGPLPGLAEFFGERVNAMLQKIKTNKHLYDMDYTMLKQMTRYCRVISTQRHRTFKDSKLSTLATILEPESDKPFARQPLDDAQTAKFLRKRPNMNPQQYQMIGDYLHSINRHYRHHTAHPHPESALILPPAAKSIREFKDKRQTFSCYSSHTGNSAVQFKHKDNIKTGFISQILQIPLEGLVETFVFINPHIPLTAAEEIHSPYHMRPNLNSMLVNSQPSEEVLLVQPQHIITHLTCAKKPAGTYKNINKNTLAICWGLNRGRR